MFLICDSNIQVYKKSLIHFVSHVQDISLIVIDTMNNSNETTGFFTIVQELYSPPSPFPVC